MDSQPALAIMYNQMYLARPQQSLARYHFAGTECSSKKGLYLVNISAGIWEQTC